eukprot:3355435-Pyramimonas_sp.AAC.1
MPSWVTAHPEFAQLVDDARAHIGLSTDPLLALEEIKECMHIATIEIKSRVYRYGVQMDTHRLMVCLKCMRAKTNGQNHLIRKCARACDQIA